jgi:hypothetical protein
MLRFTIRHRAKPDLYAFFADDPSLPAEVVEHYQTVIEDLQPLGFEPAGGVFLPNATPVTKAFVLLLRQAQNKEVAWATAIYSCTRRETRLQTAHLGISTWYPDQSFYTTNHSVVGAFPRRPRQTKTQLPMVEGNRLYRLHQAVLGREAPAEKKVLRLDDEFKGDVAAYVQNSMCEEFRDAADGGYMCLSTDGTMYVPTWKGAFLMTWSQLWPFKAIKRARIKRTARQLLHELG